MAHKDTIISYMIEHKGFYCDDCLSKLCFINPRQIIFQICSKLNENGKINRYVSICSCCGKKKIVNSIPKNTFANNNNYDKSSENIVYNNSKFNKVRLIFENYDIKDTFSKFKAHTLAGILTKNKYIKLKDECDKKYKKYMNMELGNFLSMLKENNILFYKEFLNSYGDQLYCKFKMENNIFDKCKGLYMYKNEGQIKYIGRVKDNYTFYQRINVGYANISLKNCYIDGQVTNCHINSLINKAGEKIEFYVMPLKNDEMICSLERELIKKYQPEWNIALK